MDLAQRSVVHGENPSTDELMPDMTVTREERLIIKKRSGTIRVQAKADAVSAARKAV